MVKYFKIWWKILNLDIRKLINFKWNEIEEKYF